VAFAPTVTVTVTAEKDELSIPILVHGIKGLTSWAVSSSGRVVFTVLVVAVIVIAHVVLVLVVLALIVLAHVVLALVVVLTHVVLAFVVVLTHVLALVVLAHVVLALVVILAHVVLAFVIILAHIVLAFVVVLAHIVLAFVVVLAHIILAVVVVLAHVVLVVGVSHVVLARVIVTHVVGLLVGPGSAVGPVGALGGIATFTTNSGVDLFRSGIGDQSFLGKDATVLVVGVVAGVTLAGVVVRVSRSEGTSLEGILWVTTDGLDLLGKLEGDGLVGSCSTGRGRVLNSRRK
jgi:hypothetical protein